MNMMDPYYDGILEQWLNGNRESVCQEILARANPAVTAVYFTKRLILERDQAVAATFARILEHQTA